MNVRNTEILDCFILEPQIFKDDRGCFLESYNRMAFEEATKIETQFVQDNESQSSYGVIRGLHAQKAPYSQAKLVRVIKGSVLDVVVDARSESHSFGKIVSVVLNDQNKNQLFVPKGCLHGFSVLEEDTIFSYKCDAFYNKSSEIGVNPFDINLNIDWKINSGFEMISDKDRQAMSWNDFVKRF